MKIALIAILLFNAVLSITNLFVNLLILDKKKKGKMLKDNQGIIDISEDIISDLTTYCKEKYDIDVFVTTQVGDQISLGYNNGNQEEKIIELRFPTSPKGTAEYNSTLEYQKEEIDEWRNKNVKAN